MGDLEKKSNVIPHIPFAEYKKRFTHLFHLDLDASGILTVQMHSNGESLKWTDATHRGLHQLTTMVSQDPEIEIFILGGTGDTYMESVAVDFSALGDLGEFAYNKMYYDGTKMCEGLVNDIDVPTIGLINGPGFHAELAMFCDITICSENTMIYDPHVVAGWVPSDGVQIAFRSAMGDKRAKYALMMGQRFDAQSALDHGMVNEVVARDRLGERAKEVAEQLLRMPRTSRRLMANTLRMPLKQAIANELRPAFAMEMFGVLASGVSEWSPEDV